MTRRRLPVEIVDSGCGGLPAAEGAWCCFSSLTDPAEGLGPAVLHFQLCLLVAQGAFRSTDAGIPRVDCGMETRGTV